MSRQIINLEQMDELLHSIKRGKMFSIYFRRATPKCLKCGAKEKSWLTTEPQYCPHCGGEIAYVRRSTVQTGVYNPSDKSIKPKGVGETFEEKRKKGLLGYYDIEAKGYRTCRLENIMRVVVDETEYYLFKGRKKQEA